MPEVHDDPSVTSGQGKPATESRTAIDKACDVLDALPGGGGDVGVAELARHLGLTKSTVFRLLTVLERNGLVERHQGRYRLGRKLHDLGAKAYEARPGVLQDAMSPFMTTLHENTRHTVNLGALLGTEVVLLDRLHGQRSMLHLVPVGSRFSSHGSSMGKALLARSPDAADELLAAPALPRLTPHTIVDPDAFRTELHHTRQRGIATTEQEARKHLSCIAVALLDEAGRPVVALGLSGLNVTFSAQTHGLLRSVAADAERVLRQVISR